MKFLFIEDDRLFFNWLTSSLPDHTCILASNFSELLTAFDTHKDIDAVFVDLILPGQDTIQLLSAAKGLADGIPTIILTGGSTRADLSRIADGFIFKSQIEDAPEVVIPQYVATVKKRIDDDGTMEQTKKLFSAIGGLRNGVPA